MRNIFSRRKSKAVKWLQAYQVMLTWENELQKRKKKQCSHERQPTSQCAHVKHHYLYFLSQLTKYVQKMKNGITYVFLLLTKKKKESCLLCKIILSVLCIQAKNGITQLSIRIFFLFHVFCTVKSRVVAIVVSFSYVLLFLMYYFIWSAKISKYKSLALWTLILGQYYG